MHQEPLALGETTNAVLVDPLGFERSIGRLNTDFDPLKFSDFCDFVVQAVFRDRIAVVVGSMFDFPKDGFLQPLLREGLVQTIRQRRIPPNSFRPENIASRHNPEVITARSLISAARQTSYPVLTSSFERTEYERLALPSLEHSICNCIAQYESLAGHLHSSEMRTRLGASNFFDIRIPPLPLDVLRRCRNSEEIPAMLMEVREEQSRVRKYFAEVSSILSDPHVPYKKRMSAVKAIQKAINQLHAQIDGAPVARFSASGGYLINGLISAAELVTGVYLADGTNTLKGGTGLLANAVGLALENGSGLRNEWRLEPLSAALHSSMNTSDAEVARHLERLFNYRQGAVRISRMPARVPRLVGR